MWNQEILLLQHFCKNKQNKTKLQSSNILGVKENKPLRKQAFENWKLSSGGKFIATFYGRSLPGFSRRLLDVQHMWNIVLGIVLEDKKAWKVLTTGRDLSPWVCHQGEFCTVVLLIQREHCADGYQSKHRQERPLAFPGAAAVWGHPLSAPPPRSSSLGTSDMGFYDHKLWILQILLERYLTLCRCDRPDC